MMVSLYTSRLDLYIYTHSVYLRGVELDYVVSRCEHPRRLPRLGESLSKLRRTGLHICILYHILYTLSIYLYYVCIYVHSVY